MAKLERLAEIDPYFRGYLDGLKDRWDTQEPASNETKPPEHAKP